MPAYSHLLDEERDPNRGHEGGRPLDLRHRQGASTSEIHRVAGTATKRPLERAMMRRFTPPEPINYYDYDAGCRVTSTSIDIRQGDPGHRHNRQSHAEKMLGLQDTVLQGILKELGKDVQIRFSVDPLHLAPEIHGPTK